MNNSKLWLLIMVLMGITVGSCKSQPTEAIATPTRVIQPSATEVPTVTAKLPPTEVILSTDIPEPVLEPVADPTPETLVVQDVLSPNRSWRATVMRTFVNGEERSIFYVYNDDSRIEWIVEDVPYEFIPLIGFPFPEPFYWSTNGQYLYFTYQSSGDGCFAGGRHKGDGLNRLDLATGTIEELSSNFASWMSISPDEKTLAYFIYARQGLILRDMETGNERSFDLVVQQEDVGMEIDQGYIVWAPDSQSLMFAVMAGVCSFEPDSYLTWQVHVDLATGTQSILFEQEEGGFVPLAWPDINKVLIQNGDGQLWWFNPTTGVIEPVQ